MEKLILIPPSPFILIANEQNSSYILHVVKGFGQFLMETLKKAPGIRLELLPMDHNIH